MNIFRTLPRDALASVVVFLVALPLCMGIAIASGMPPAKGLITGIIGGLVVGFIAGAPLQVSGPAAGLAVLVFELVRTHGMAALGPVLLLAGLIQLVAGALRLGGWFRVTAPAVVYGMLAGRPNIYLESSLSYEFIDPVLAEQIIRKHGHEKVFFGTDYPFGNIRHSLAAARAVPFLTSQEKEDILGRNAWKFFFG